MAKSDGCTGFFQNWLAWRKPTSWRELYRILEIKPLKPCCVKHDNVGGKGCSSHAFFKCLYEGNFVAGMPIFTIASIACWVKEPKEMRDKV